jgi:hypothetical protein
MSSKGAEGFSDQNPRAEPTILLLLEALPRLLGLRGRLGLPPNSGMPLPRLAGLRAGISTSPHTGSISQNPLKTIHGSAATVVAACNVRVPLAVNVTQNHMSMIKKIPVALITAVGKKNAP